MERVFLSLGSNLGDSEGVIREALLKIAELPFVLHFQKSPLYMTSPVSDLPQADFVNAICCFDTLESIDIVWKALQSIELLLGKESKPKNAPRLIDIDILLFGHRFSKDPNLILPHPEMLNRLFVLYPLSDITENIRYPKSETLIVNIHLPSCLQSFTNKQQQRVSKLIDIVSLK